VHLEPVEARSSARHSGENIDRLDRVARAARTHHDDEHDEGTGEPALDDTERELADVLVEGEPEPQPAAEPAPAAKPKRRRATKAQGAPTPVG
jgi:hypothetical protein